MRSARARPATHLSTCCLLTTPMDCLHQQLTVAVLGTRLPSQLRHCPVFSTGLKSVAGFTVGLEGMASSTEAHIHLTMDEADARGIVARITIDYQPHLNILNTPLILALTSAVNS